MGSMANGGSDTDLKRALDDQRERFHRELMRKSLRITELEVELAQQRAEWEKSLSWRITKPLRIRSYIRQRLAGAANRD
jgi:hypothetical protein